jgi:phosphoesterase RecJ-like protein
MNYKQSKEILKEVKKAKKILVNCHRGPDPDSIGSALGLFAALKNLGKEVEIVCPSKEFPQTTSFLDNFNKIKYPTDFTKFDFSKFDLFVTLDSSSWEMVSGLKGSTPPKLPIVVIDHHKTNTSYGKINLVDDKVTSTGELLYLVLEDWGLEMDESIATPLLTGIIGDTGAFRYVGTGAKTFKIASKLMDLGADKDEIVFHIYHSVSEALLRFWGEVILKMQIDKEHRFTWTAIPYEKYLEMGSLMSGRESAAGLFGEVIEGTDFGVIMVEQEKNRLSVSMRSRTGFDTSKIAVELGGGGHVFASGAKIEGLPFENAVNQVLEVARKYAKQSIKKDN